MLTEEQETACHYAVLTLEHALEIAGQDEIQQARIIDWVDDGWRVYR